MVCKDHPHPTDCCKNDVKAPTIHRRRRRCCWYLSPPSSPPPLSMTKIHPFHDVNGPYIILRFRHNLSIRNNNTKTNSANSVIAGMAATWGGEKDFL
jgi:hypothetical protein